MIETATFLLHRQRVARNTFVVIIAVVLTLVQATPGFAWGPEGHDIVAAIAQQHLTPDAKMAIQTLLGSAHIYDSDIANFADAWRVTHPETAPWHFVDIPISSDAVDLNRYCGERQCVVDKIEDFRDYLARFDRGLETEAFVARLRSRCSIPILTEDERLTTSIARRMPTTSRGQTPGEDAQAAAVLLQTFLDRRPGE